MLSCVGLIFLGLDYLMIRRLLYEEETSMKFFLAVAANQVALTICAGIPWGSFLETLPGGAIALLVVGLAYRYVRRLDQ